MSYAEQGSTSNINASTSTILSTIHQLTAQDVFHNTTVTEPHTFHPFTANEKDTPLDQLIDLQNATTSIIESLQDYATMPVTDSKFVSILKQFSAIAQNIHFSERETRRRADAFRDRPSTMYGEPIPLDRPAIVDWAISRFEGWAKDAGMETFRDESTPGHVTMMLGGKMLVLDVDFVTQRARTPLDEASIRVASVKTSHALPSDTSTNAIAVGSGGLDDLIKSTWNHYLDEVQLDAVESSMRAAQLRQDIQRQMRYLLALDALAVPEGDTGIRWFNDVGNMNVTAQQLVRPEAEVVASSLSCPTAPLDIFLARAHALPMPYLVAPFMSFLVYTSPLAYYSILKSWQSSQRVHVVPPSAQPEKLDIPTQFLRRYLLKKTSRPSGAIIATLSLEPFPVHYRPRSDPLSLLLRPNFLLLPELSLSGIDHILLEPTHSIPGLPGSIAAMHKDTWVLDFTDNGASKGVVMSQSRMREIQLVIDPDTSMREFGMTVEGVYRSWIHLLLCPLSPAPFNPAERFVTEYRSTSNAHPPLRLRLTPPDEAGFLLGKVPVRTLKEVWGVLEVVRDQCWLNETLKSCNWVPETAEDLRDEDGARGADADSGGGGGRGNSGAEATEDELNAVLNGTFQTRRIPVNVSLPYATTSVPSMQIFPDPDGTDPFSIGRTTSVPRFTMDVHTRAHHSAPSLVQIHVTHDPTRTRGVRVEVNGTLPLTTQQVEELEEFVRRGAVMGVAGKVWSWEMA